MNAPTPPPNSLYKFSEHFPESEGLINLLKDVKEIRRKKNILAWTACVCYLPQVAKIWALGWPRYRASWLNRFDGVLTVVLLVSCSGFMFSSIFSLC